MKSPFSLGVIIILFLSLAFIRLSDKNWGQNNNYGVLAWDNFGYYLYLPATFIYDDLKIEHLEWVHDIREKYKPSDGFYQAHFIEEGTHVIQYTMGMAVIYMPAFWAGHLYALASDNYPADGFSAPYQFAVLLYSLCLLAIGLYFLRKLALAYFSDKIVALSIIALCFGSNYFQLTSTNTSSPHAILFPFYAILLYLVYKWHLKPSYRLSSLFAVLFGVMVLARPNELIFCLIPILWGVSSWSSFKNKIRFFLNNYKHLLLIIGILTCIGSLQMLYWKFTSNHWLYDSYTNEGFKLLSPYLSEYLFSYKKGWLIYSPIFFLLIVGYYQLYKKSKQLAFPLLLHFIFTIWVLSSWDNWWYADSFSQRSIVQCYPVFIFPFAFFMESLWSKKTVLKFSVFGLILLLIGLNLFQTYQVNKWIIHTQRMTKDYYWQVFGETNIESTTRSLLAPKRQINYLPQELNYSQKVLIDSKENLKLSPERPFSKKLAFAADKISEEGFLYLEAIVSYQVEKVDNGKLGVVFQTLDHRSKKYYSFIYEPKSLKILPHHQTLSAVYAPPHLRSMSDSIEVYLWLYDNATVEIDQFTLVCYDPRKTKTKNSFYSNESAGSINYWSSPYIDSAGQYSSYYQTDSLHQFSATLDKEASAVDFKSGNFQISINGLHTAEEGEVYAVVSLMEGNENSYYKAFRLSHEKEFWNKWMFSGKISKPITKKGSLKFYLWNKSKAPFYYQQISLEFE